MPSSKRAACCFRRANFASQTAYNPYTVFFSSFLNGIGGRNSAAGIGVAFRNFGRCVQISCPTSWGAQFKNRFSRFSGTAASGAALHMREIIDTVNIRLSSHFLSSIRRSSNAFVLDFMFSPGLVKLQPRFYRCATTTTHGIFDAEIIMRC